jgi:hypothetical protein
LLWYRFPALKFLLEVCEILKHWEHLWHMLITLTLCGMSTYIPLSLSLFEDCKQWCWKK